MMSTTDQPGAESGENRFRKRRSAFWRYSILVFIGAMVAGMVSGAAAQWTLEGLLPRWALVAIWALVVVAFVWFARDYVRRIDELDLMDNFWAAVVGIHFYIVAMPSWQLFHNAGMTDAPNQYIIYLATIAVMVVTYFARKLGWR